jgi:hypothetical protein
MTLLGLARELVQVPAPASVIVEAPSAADVA